jgi:FMN-dependent NADH-azoreductase
VRLLRIDSSARTSSVSRWLTSTFADAWRGAHPDGDVVERDLSATVLPPITDDWSATYGDPSTLTQAQRAYLTTSDELIAELIAADVIVIGAPMYNLTISSELKAWIDQVVRFGKTVASDANGSKGLLSGR